jgi:hypothetical protein
LPCGEGLLAYRAEREAIAAIESVCKDYDRHRLAARAVAEAYFDAKKAFRPS